MKTCTRHPPTGTCNGLVQLIRMDGSTRQIWVKSTIENIMFLAILHLKIDRLDKMSGTVLAQYIFGPAYTHVYQNVCPSLFTYTINYWDYGTRYVTCKIHEKAMIPNRYRYNEFHMLPQKPNRKLDEKTMIRNRYNRIPLSSPKTIRERNTHTQTHTKYIFLFKRRACLVDCFQMYKHTYI